MNNKFTLFLVALTIVATGIFASVDADAAKRKVVLEDHTGAWCGFCPRGMETLEKLEEQYGEMIIGVGVHNGDAMATPYQNTLKTQVGVTGYPNGTVNRVTYNGKIAQSDGVWNTIAQQIVNTDVPVGVTLEVDYNSTTGEYTATITADVESTVNDQLAWNLWVLEDYVTGSGSQYDQKNYLSKTGSSPMPSSKYYEYPPTIPNFNHMDVFRKAHGGTLGDTDGFPMPATADTYTKTYTSNIADANIQNNANVFFVAVVHNTVTKEIINADRVGKVIKEKNRVTAEGDDLYVTVSENSDYEREITITNENDWAINTNVSVDTEGSLTPEGWNVEVSSDMLNIPANGSKTFKVTVNKNGIEGYAQVKVNIEPETTEERIGVKTDITAYYMSDNIENAIIFGLDNITPIVQAMGASDKFTNPVLVSGADEVVANFPQMENFGSVIMTIDDRTAGFSVAASKSRLDLIKAIRANGGNLFLTSAYDFIVANNIFSNVTANPEATAFLKDDLGVDFGFAFNSVVNGNQVVISSMVGEAGDPVGDGVNAPQYNAVPTQALPYNTYYVASMTINGKTNAIPFMRVDESLTTSLNNQNNITGIRLDNNGQRTIFMTIPTDPLPANVRTKLFAQATTWLMDGAAAVGPTITLNVDDVKFGTVETGKSASSAVRVTAGSDEALVINEITFKNGTHFSVDGSFPMTIDAGTSENIIVNFAPNVDGEFTDEMMIASNATNGATKTVTLSGKTSTSSVDGIISGLFEMNMVPNPVVDNSQIELQVNQSANVTLELIDATGKSFGVIYNETTTGDSFNFNSSELTSGTYYINANVDGKTTQLPVVITK